MNKNQSGGQIVVRQKGTKWMSDIGRIGGSNTAKRYGSNYMSLLAQASNDKQHHNLTPKERTALLSKIQNILA